MGRWQNPDAANFVRGCEQSSRLTESLRKASFFYGSANDASSFKSDFRLAV